MMYPFNVRHAAKRSIHHACHTFCTLVASNQIIFRV